MPDTNSPALQSLPLRYGLNPHQYADCLIPAQALQVLHGTPSMTNLLDVLTGWQIARDVRQSSGELCAISMKHCSPVGMALPGPIDAFTQALLGKLSLDDAGRAYLRARSSDWSAAYGDIAVFAGPVSAQTAQLLSRLVCDGVAASGYSADALAILQKKKGGRFLICQMDPEYQPPAVERREMMGVVLQQERNARLPERSDFRVVAGSREMLARREDDLLMACIAMKYCASNNAVIAAGRRVLALAVGQQSRISSVDIACNKLSNWARLQQPHIVEAVKGMSGPLTERIHDAVALSMDSSLDAAVPPSVLTSDGFIPFADSVERAADAGVRVVAAPGGALRGRTIREAAQLRGITLLESAYRYFYH